MSSECKLKFYKLFLMFNNNKVTYTKLFGCLRIGLCSVQWFVFLELLTPFTLGGCNFFISNPFSTIVMCQMHEEGVQVLFGH